MEVPTPSFNNTFPLYVIFYTSKLRNFSPLFSPSFVLSIFLEINFLSLTAVVIIKFVTVLDPGSCIEVRLSLVLYVFPNIR